MSIEETCPELVLSLVRAMSWHRWSPRVPPAVRGVATSTLKEKQKRII